MSSMIHEIEKRIAGKKILLLGVGNRLRGDDAIGSLLVERLQNRVRIPLIDAGDAPENYLGPIESARADLVLIVDAANIGAGAGDMALVTLDQLKEFAVSTHTTNLSLLFKVIPEEARPDALLVAIQPESTEMGQGLSDSVRDSLDGLENLFLRLFG